MLYDEKKLLTYDLDPSNRVMIRGFKTVGIAFEKKPMVKPYYPYVIYEGDKLTLYNCEFDHDRLELSAPEFMFVFVPWKFMHCMNNLVFVDGADNSKIYFET